MNGIGRRFRPLNELCRSNPWSKRRRESVHRDFLLLRDYTALSLLFLVALGIVASFAVRPATVLMGYLGFLVLHSRWFAWRPRTAASGLSPRCSPSERGDPAARLVRERIRRSVLPPIA